MTTDNTKLDETLEALVRYVERGEANGRPVHFIADYKQSILQWVADEIIGSDVVPNMHDGLLNQVQTRLNALRKRQRNILKQHGWEDKS